jgi:hypothetical protein
MIYHQSISEADSMATVDVSKASSTLTSSSFMRSAVLVVVGSLMAQLVTDWMRRNVIDISQKGGDAVYPLIAALIALSIMPSSYGRPVALGSTATSVRVVIKEFGLM